MPIAHRRGREIEARRIDETSLDAVEPGIPVEQVIVVAHLVAAEREGARAEIPAFARELAVERQSELRDVARRRALVRIGEPGGVDINRRVHPELTRFRSHLRREPRFAAAQRFGQHDGRVIRRFRHDAEDQILHRYRFAGLETELRWRAACRVIRHLEILVEPQPSPVERLEGQIQRHHFRERCRRSRNVSVELVQDLSGLRIEHDRLVNRMCHYRQRQQAAHDDCSSARSADPPPFRHRATHSLLRLG